MGINKLSTHLGGVVNISCFVGQLVHTPLLITWVRGITYPHNIVNNLSEGVLLVHTDTGGGGDNLYLTDPPLAWGYIPPFPPYVWVSPSTY